ncbi:MAG TPA: carboxymuconolactone decarboxylase family protein [Solirubrobacteraceae bacterium]|jgi:alkylhydroperoxidase family enzyme|nr:carboxymuconolactone decarboxylase family protein [Solirubrobacteraceae bacterium]
MPEPRIAPLQPPYEPETEAMLSKWMPPGSEVEPLALFRTLARHEGLFSRMRPLGAGLLGHPRLDPRERELLILRTCARAGAEYEWGVHAVAYGGAVGLSEEQIAATAHGSPEDSVWAQGDGLLIAAADALYETDTLPEALWQELAARFSEDRLLELVTVAGWYRLISYLINAVGIELEPWAARFP